MCIRDRTKVIKLLYEVFKGSSKDAISILKELFEKGIEAKYFLNDILEILTLINRKLSLGSIENDKVLPEEEINLINEISNGISIEDIGLFWQLTLKTIDDLRIISDEEVTLEMYVMQLLHLKGVKAYPAEETIEVATSIDSKKKEMTKGEDNYKESSPLKIKSQLKNTDQIKTNLIKDTLVEKKKTKINITSFRSLKRYCNCNGP